VGFLVAAAAGAVVLGHTVAFDVEVDSRRALGFVMFGPVAFGVFGVIGVVRAVRAVRPWRAYIGATRPQQRQRDRAHDLATGPVWHLWLFGIVGLAGLIALAVVFVVLPSGGIREVPGVVLWFEFEVLLAMTAVGCLVLAVRTVRARRSLGESNSVIAPRTDGR
jgi:hypothetical protein